MPESQSASSWRLRVPQWRISVHLVSSPKVTKVIGRFPLIVDTLIIGS
jgi:hypothetical protein